MDIVVRNDGVRLLHEHCIRIRTKQKYEESDTPKGTPVLLSVGAGEAIHERLMRARGKGEDGSPSPPAEDQPDVQNTVKAWEASSSRIDAEHAPAPSRAKLRADGAGELAGNQNVGSHGGVKQQAVERSNVRDGPKEGGEESSHRRRVRKRDISHLPVSCPQRKRMGKRRTGDEERAKSRSQHRGVAGPLGSSVLIVSAPTKKAERSPIPSAKRSLEKPHYRASRIECRRIVMQPHAMNGGERAQLRLEEQGLGRPTGRGAIA
jgi:hypothetical protein